MITYEDFRDKRREYAFTKSVSDNPKDQDAARKIRTQMDYDDLKKQIGSKKKPAKPAVAEEHIDERLGGKGYKSYTSLTGKKISGDWEDSDRGAGNKAKKRAGGKVEKKSPTYKAHVLNKEDKAFDYVVAKLKKQHGDGVLTKGDKMPEPSAAQKKKNAAIRAKRAKEDHRDPTEKASSGRYSDRYSNRGSD